MAKITRPYNFLNEDDANQQQQNNQQQQQPKPQATPNVNYAQQLAQIQFEIDRKEKEFNAFKSLKQELMNKIRMKAAEEGIDLTNKNNESTSYRFSKKLYESLQTSKAEELAAAVKTTFDNLDTLSYYMDNKGCTTFARRLLAWLNEQNWNDGKDHWEDVEEKVRLLLSGGNISMSRREISEFNNEFQNVLRNNTVFGWIFGIH